MRVICIKYSFLFFISVVCNLPVLAQQADSLEYQNPYTIPPLEELIQAALEYSPLLQEQKAIIGREKQNLEIVRKKWMDKVFTDVGYGYSNNYAATSVAANNSRDFESISTIAGDNYRAGITVRIGMFDVFARKNLKKKEMYQIQAAQHRKTTIQNEIRLKTILFYKELQLSQRILKIKSDKKQALSLQKQMAEKEFLQGELHISELGRITELSSNAMTDFEKAITAYEKAYITLENHVGTRLDDF